MLSAIRELHSAQKCNYQLNDEQHQEQHNINMTFYSLFGIFLSIKFMYEFCFTSFDKINKS